MPFTVTVRNNRIRQVQATISDNSVDAVRDSMKYCRDYAQSIAPVRTGAFRASLYVNGPLGESDYAQAAAQAAKLNPKAQIIPELQAAQIDPGLGQLRNNLGMFTHPEALMGSAVYYSYDLEIGTAGRAPRPTFHQAAMVAEQRFKADMAKVANV